MASDILSLLSSGLNSTPVVCATCGTRTTQTRTLTFTPSPTVISSLTTRTVTLSAGGRTSVFVAPTLLTRTRSPSAITQTFTLTTSPSSTVISTPEASISPEFSTQLSQTIIIILGVSIPLVSIILLACLCFFIRRRKRKAAAQTPAYKLRPVRSMKAMPEVKAKDGARIVPAGYVSENGKKSSDLPRSNSYPDAFSPVELDGKEHAALGNTFSKIQRQPPHELYAHQRDSHSTVEDHDEDSASFQANTLSHSYSAPNDSHVARGEACQLTPAPLRIMKKHSLDESVSWRSPNQSTSVSRIVSPEPSPILRFNFGLQLQTPVTRMNRGFEGPVEDERRVWYERTRARLERPEALQRSPWRSSSIYSRDESGIPFPPRKHP
ncbi:hypothetical protein PVAG01_02497 [Phlyctema vagabunda]|uniref:Uncharacterized protein n=1 Tax=Phlyctema vagabunda TaxID=108571 RepID=A0ABR4PS32_9HELO